MAKKPERKMNEPESPEHAPKPKRPPFSKRHPHLAKAAKAVGTGMLALGVGCAPAARAQTPTTPSRPATTMVQSPDVRVAPATTGTQPTRVAQATIPSSAQTSTYTETSTGGSAGPNPTDRVLEIPTTAQPVVVTGEEVRNNMGYMFENRNATVMDLPASGKITMGDWEVEVTPSRIDFLTITIRNAILDYEYETGALRNSKLVLLPFTETEYAKGPLFAIVSSAYARVHFFNKVSDCVTMHGFIYTDQMPGNETPEVGTEITNNEPYLVVVHAGSRTADGDVLPGTRIFQYALGTTERDGDGPAAGISYFVREE
jgi:hypothetical protein